MTSEQNKLDGIGENKNSLSKNVLPIGLIIIAILLFRSSLAKSKNGIDNTKVTRIILSPTPTVKVEMSVEEIRESISQKLEKLKEERQKDTPLPTPTSISPQQIFQEIGTKGAKESSVTALQQSDGSWVVTNIINDWPELSAETFVKEWVRNFMYEVYHSGYQIKQVGVTITAPRHIGKYVRAWLGVNQAKTITNDYWNMGPTNFYNWLIDVETSRDEPNRANRTFVEDNL